MLNVKSIKINTIVSGLYAWYPATFVNLLRNGKKTEQNDVVEAIKENWLKTIVITGGINKNPEAKVLISWLCSIGYLVILYTDSSDDIWPLRGIKNCNFVIKTTAPNERENEINFNTMNCLKPTDELLFEIDNAQTYEEVLTFLTSRPTTQPTVTFIVSDELKTQIISDSTKFKFKCRILSA